MTAIDQANMSAGEQIYSDHRGRDRRRQNSSNRIYERYFSTKLGGSSVGLAICQTIIKAHGGKLEARAIEFYVTIFRVILPLGGEE